MLPLNPHQSTWHYYLTISDCLQRYDTWASAHGHDEALRLTIRHLTANRSTILNAAARYHSNYCQHSDAQKQQLDACITQLLVETNFTQKQLAYTESLLTQWVADFNNLMASAQMALSTFIKAKCARQRQAYNRDPKAWFSEARKACGTMRQRVSAYPHKLRRIMWFGEDISCIIEAIGSLDSDEDMAMLKRRFALDDEATHTDWAAFCCDMIVWSEAMLVEWKASEEKGRYPLEKPHEPTPLIYVFWRHTRKLRLVTDDLCLIWARKHHYHLTMASSATEQCRNLKHADVVEAAGLSRRTKDWLCVDMATRLAIGKPPYCDAIRFFKDRESDPLTFDAAITLTAVAHRFIQKPHSDFTITRWAGLPLTMLFNASWHKIGCLFKAPIELPVTSPCKATPTPPPTDYPTEERYAKRSLSTGALLTDGHETTRIKSQG